MEINNVVGKISFRSQESFGTFMVRKAGTRLKRNISIIICDENGTVVIGYVIESTNAQLDRTRTLHEPRFKTFYEPN